VSQPLANEQEEFAMKIVRMILTASVAGLLAAAPLGLVQAATAHDHSHGASTGKAKAKAVKKTAKKKAPAHSGPMQMSMHGGGSQMGGMQMGMMKKGGMKGMMQHHHAGMIQCPMMLGAAQTPFQAMRMQWHCNMMMWHHQMMHGQSPMHRGS
jgi:hypothetical protein